MAVRHGYGPPTRYRPWAYKKCQADRAGPLQKLKFRIPGKKARGFGANAGASPRPFRKFGRQGNGLYLSSHTFRLLIHIDLFGKYEHIVELLPKALHKVLRFASTP